MLYTNNSYGTDFAKDPAVIKYKGIKYLYHTVRYDKNKIGIGIAADDGENSEAGNENYRTVGELPLLLECEKNGIGAPGVIEIGGKIHMFYQTYGNRERDAICHAVSEDGINFTRLGKVFSPTGEYTCGRAIDADVCVFKDKLMLYIATRDREYKKQFLLAASSPLDLISETGECSFVQESSCPLLYPELPWEGECIEAPAAFVRGDAVYMFYGGSYNCTPQQIGLAKSYDGVNFFRLSDKPFLRNGKAGEWNESESGHPYIAIYDGRYFLYYQGSADRGKSFYLSSVEIGFDGDIPILLPRKAGK